MLAVVMFVLSLFVFIVRSSVVVGSRFLRCCMFVVLCCSFCECVFDCVGCYCALRFFIMSMPACDSRLCAFTFAVLCACACPDCCVIVCM